MPPALRDWLPEGHLALFISDVVEALDMKPILVAYENGDGRGQPPYYPAMMVKLLVYAYCMATPSSRQIERATYEEIPYRLLAANQHPDHDSLAASRQRHLAALAGLFGQVFQPCQRAGLVSLGHVALDGTKILANASKHKAIVEPVFGQIKAGRGIRRFAFRGQAKVTAEWLLICLRHNLLKLFRSGWTPPRGRDGHGQGRFATPAEARLAVFDFIEGWYNSRRRHSALSYFAPIAYEQRELSLV